MQKAVCNHATLVKRGRVFRLFSENVTLPNGVTLDMEIIRHPGAAAIVPLMDDGSVLLLRQYRHALDDCIWEIPAGTLEPGEDARHCARRELVEETGYTAQVIEQLTVITPLPAYSDEHIHIFLASGLNEAEQQLDDDELLSVHRLELTRAVAMIAAGEIQDAKTIAGLLLVARRVG